MLSIAKIIKRVLRGKYAKRHGLYGKKLLIQYQLTLNKKIKKIKKLFSTWGMTNNPL